MKTHLATALLCLLTISVYAQTPRFSAELNYPLPTGDNFMEDNYTGIVDAGAKFRFLRIPMVNLGVSVNGSHLKRTAGASDITVAAWLIQPRLFAELDWSALKKFRPSLGAGYTLGYFDASGTTDSGTDFNESTQRKGFNANVGLAYDVWKGLFVQVQYDYIHLEAEEDALDIPFNRQVSLVKAGVGYRF